MVRGAVARDLAAVFAAVAVVACGSTAQVGGGVVGGSDVAAPADQGLGPPVAQTSASDEASARPGAARPGASASGPAGEDLAAGDTAAEAPVPTEVAPTSARPPSDDGAPDDGARPVAAGTTGLDDERLLLGVEIAEGAEQANESLGASVSPGDTRANYDALLAWINGTGGIAGRRVEVVYHNYDPFSSQSMPSQEQAACSAFTQDHEVYAVASSLRHTDTLPQCLGEQGVPLVSTSTSNADEDTFQRFPRFLAPNNISLHAISKVWPGGLSANGYFDPRSPTEDVTVGIFTYDNQRHHRTVEEALKPALEAVGHPSVHEVYGRDFHTVSDASGLSTDATNATVRFRREGVTHVLILDNGSGAATLFFTQAAENQGWRPRYGLNSNNGGQGIIEAGAPPAQFEDSVSLGWFPLLDVPPGERDPANRVEQRCEAVFSEAGITLGSANERSVAMAQCEQFLFLRASVAATSGPVSHDSVITGGAALGTSHLSPLVGPTRLSGDRRYGVSRYRPNAFESGCQCFQYIGGWQPL